MYGEELDRYAYGMWSVVISNVLIFTLLALDFLRPKRLDSYS